MARVRFESIFIQHPDGSIEPRQRMRVGGITIGHGVRFVRGVSFAGIDFTQFIGHDLEVEVDKDVLVITGIY